MKVTLNSIAGATDNNHLDLESIHNDPSLTNSKRKSPNSHQSSNDGLSFQMPKKGAAKIRENFEANTTVEQVKRQEKSIEELEA